MCRVIALSAAALHCTRQHDLCQVVSDSLFANPSQLAALVWGRQAILVVCQRQAHPRCHFRSLPGRRPQCTTPPPHHISLALDRRIYRPNSPSKTASETTERTGHPATCAGAYRHVRALSSTAAPNPGVPSRMRSRAPTSTSASQRASWPSMRCSSAAASPSSGKRMGRDANGAGFVHIGPEVEDHRKEGDLVGRSQSCFHRRTISSGVRDSLLDDARVSGTNDRRRNARSRCASIMRPVGIEPTT